MTVRNYPTGYTVHDFLNVLYILYPQFLHQRTSALVEPRTSLLIVCWGIVRYNSLGKDARALKNEVLLIVCRLGDFVVQQVM